MSDQEGKAFVMGVIEGFYGRPWTQNQRLDLFSRLKKLGLNTYMYAPKDDVKHRKHWRQKYIGTEQDMLKALICGAEACGIQFVYSISPGLDIIFSCPRDIEFLKAKMKQVADLGCKCFALLFDDIEQELSLPDKQDFQSFADAQVNITNQIYEHLGSPEIFLFCPTEYCATRAKPSVKKSEYLTTLGKKLNKKIDILWTGPKVVSKQISTLSIKAVAKVLQRKPVIWDNIHANDYDNRRIFLGPFNGRPTDLYKHLNGLMTNPNCEYECNFIALHTMSTWINCCVGISIKTRKSLSENSGKSDSSGKSDKEMDIVDDAVKVVEEIEMESLDKSNLLKGKEIVEPMEMITDSDSRNQSPDSMMDAEDAIKDTTRASEDLFAKSAAGENAPHGQDVMKSTAESKSASTIAGGQLENATHTPREYDSNIALGFALSVWFEEFTKVKELRKGIEDLCTSPSKMVIGDGANSLIDVKRSDVDDDSAESTMKDSSSSETDEASEGEAECCPHHLIGRKKLVAKKSNITNVTEKDLFLLVDMFFLPYEHGEQAKRLVSEFKWLTQNAPPVHSKGAKTRKNYKQYLLPLMWKADEWEKRASEFYEHCQAVFDLFLRVTHGPNKPLVHELYPYIWDVKEIVTLLNAFIKWLGSKDRKCNEGKALIPEDPEPWMFKGGIAQQLERLLPTDGINDLFFPSKRSAMSADIYTIRPYLDTDKTALYDLCLETCDELGRDGSDLFPNHPELAGDRYLGAYLEYSKGCTFVVEDENGLCGYCVAAQDTRGFNKKVCEWRRKMSGNYKRPSGERTEWSHEQELVEDLYEPTFFLPDHLSSEYPAHVVIKLLPRAKGTSIGTRLLACLMSVLKANGVTGVHCAVSSCNEQIIKFFSDLGFSSLHLKKSPLDGQIILGRTI